ncbi:hypothetical protein EAF04_002251 [Stromatinia cepivora]|nr:hypothetical protein EAF04_002251 [Stromatinia cepivora]
MTPYPKPLSLSHREIRCLILQPLSSGAPIQCTVETISLLSNPEYEALSYVWGDASIQRTITFNEVPFSVTQNLAIALHHLRLPDKPRRLWVDALCINQSDVQERNEQVGLMGEIYSMAKPVLIWLGESFEGSDEAFISMSKIAVTGETGNEITEEVSQTMFSFYIQLVEKEWFTRLWTIQELVLANQDPLVGCGFTWTTWSLLLKAWEKVAMIEFTKMGMIMKEAGLENKNENKTTDASSVRTSAIRIDLLGNLRTAVANKQGEDLRDLLLNTISSKATEPRDRIYALLGMMHPLDRQTQTVDYDRPLGTIYAEAISHIFRKGQGPFLLSGMELAGPNPPSQYSSFPSWVPRLGSKHLLNPTRFHPPGVGVSGAGSTAINGYISSDLKTLSIRGLPIDTISEKFTFGPENQYLTQLPHVENLVLKAQHLATLHSNHRPYLHTFKTKEPVWRTLIANKLYSGAAREVAPDSYGEMYEILLSQNKQDHNAHDNTSQGRDSSPCRDNCPTHNNPPETKPYTLSLQTHLPNTTFFITTTGFCGLSPSTIETGDLLALCFGAPAPFILRRVKGRYQQQCSSKECGIMAVEGREDSDCERKEEGQGKVEKEKEEEEGEEIYNILGIAYVSGIMEGEIVDEVYCEDLEDDITFTIR